MKRQASTYAETVKRGSGSKHKQHAEHHKNRQHKGRTRRGKNSNGESNATPSSLASPDESPNAHNSFRQRDKIQVAGSRKIWGTLKSTTTSAVSNAVCSLTGMNADHLIFKRKYKTNPTKNSSKWWFVIRSDEALLKDLEEKWHLIALAN